MKKRLQGLVLGLILGGGLVAGLAPASGRSEWGPAPMQAKVGTHLYREGYCKDPKRMTPVQVFTPTSAQYQCKPKFKGAPGAP